MGPQGIWISLIVGLAVACVLLLGRLYWMNQRLKVQAY
jgi:MATE family multidrug resistance protein